MTGPIAWLVNGIALYGWSDGLSYNGANIWQSISLAFNQYNLDICYGEATTSALYHRKYSLTDFIKITTNIFY